MAGDGPFVWLGEYAPPSGFRRLPPGGMCLSAFLFVRRGPRILLGKFQEHPSWESLAGMDAQEVRKDKDRWTIPSRALRLGEDPREAARHIGEVILGINGMRYSEPRVEVEFWRLGDEASGPAERRKLFHFDVWFLVDATRAKDHEVIPPQWYAELSWALPARIPKKAWGRLHGDVAARWGERRPAP